MQATIIPVSGKQGSYAKEVYEELRKANIRVELDASSDTLGKRIREAKTSKVPYILVVGDEEMGTETATLEGRSGKVGALPLPEIILRLKAEIEGRV